VPNPKSLRKLAPPSWNDNQQRDRHGKLTIKRYSSDRHRLSLLHNDLVRTRFVGRLKSSRSVGPKSAELSIRFATTTDCLTPAPTHPRCELSQGSGPANEVKALGAKAPTGKSICGGRGRLVEVRSKSGWRKSFATSSYLPALFNPDFLDARELPS
jgi:hypothetical protein